jgi:hypothetical protein
VLHAGANRTVFTGPWTTASTTAHTVWTTIANATEHANTPSARTLRLRQGSFVQRWGLPLNPEDLDELALAVLMHHDGIAVPESPDGWQDISEAVNAQIDEFEERWGRGSGGHPENSVKPNPSR